MRTRLVLATLTLAVAAEACFSDSVVAPPSVDTLGAALAEVTIPALDYVAAMFSGAGVVTPTIDPARCQFEGASGWFVCGALSGGGLTLNQHYTLLDAAGGKQSTYDMTSTSGLVVNSAVTGTATGHGVTLTVDGQQELVLSGLGTPQHTLNGSSITMTTLSRVDGFEPPVTSRITTKVVDLVVPIAPPGEPPPWPVSGMIELRTTTDLGLVIPTVNPASTVSTAAMAFNGSSVVTLTITTESGTTSCRVDIATTLLGC